MLTKYAHYSQMQKSILQMLYKIQASFFKTEALVQLIVLAYLPISKPPIPVAIDAENPNQPAFTCCPSICPPDRCMHKEYSNKHHSRYHKFKNKLECGQMPNVMAALPNIGCALCSMPQSLADAHYLTAMQ